MYKRSGRFLRITVFFGLITLALGFGFYIISPKDVPLDRLLKMKAGRKPAESITIKPDGPLTVEEKGDRVKPSAKTLGDRAIEAVTGVCRKRGWDQGKARVHTYKDAVTVWYPSVYGGSDSVTVGVDDGRMISEFEMKGFAPDGSQIYAGRYYNDDGTVVETHYKGSAPHGVRTVYDADGSVKSETRFVEGKKEGK